MNLGINIYNLFEFLMVVFFYRKKVDWPNKNLITAIAIVLFMVFGLINLFFVQGLHYYNTYTVVVSSASIAILSIVYFYNTLEQPAVDSIAKRPMFWIDTGILIYFGVNFFFSCAQDFLVRVLNNDLITFFMAQHMLIIICFCMIWYAFILVRLNHRKQ